MKYCLPLVCVYFLQTGVAWEKSDSLARIIHWVGYRMGSCSAVGNCSIIVHCIGAAAAACAANLRHVHLVRVLFQHHGKIPLSDCTLVEDPGCEFINIDDDSKSKYREARSGIAAQHCCHLSAIVYNWLSPFNFRIASLSAIVKAEITYIGPVMPCIGSAYGE